MFSSRIDGNESLINNFTKKNLNFVLCLLSTNYLSKLNYLILMVDLVQVVIVADIKVIKLIEILSVKNLADSLEVLFLED